MKDKVEAILREKWYKAEDKEPFNVEDNVGAIPTHQNYVDRYNRAKLKPNSGLGIQVICDRIQKNKERYLKVENLTGVPWYFVGALHAMESSLDFNAWLANGDSLNGPTINVPEGLKLTGKHQDKFVDGAVVSLEHDGFQDLKFNDIGDILIAAESYNGLGYLTGAGRATTPPETSPYLWSGTDQYEKGKYIADGKFSAEAVSGQAGVVGIFKELAARGELIFGGKGTPKPEPKPSEDVTWVKFFRDGFVNTVIGYAGSKATVKLNTSDKKELISFLEKHPKASTFHVAAASEEIPKLNVTPGPNPEPPPTESESFMLLQKAQQAIGPDGFVPLVLEVFDRFGVSKGSLRVLSGLRDAQVFKIGSASRSGSGEPCPEGMYSVGMIEFQAGKDNYDGNYGTGLGPMWIDIIPSFSTQRAALGIHIDTNVKGTIGCVGLLDVPAARKLVQLLRAHDPQRLYCDWGLGTCPPTPKINNA